MATKSIPTSAQLMDALRARGEAPSDLETNLFSLVMDLESYRSRAIDTARELARDMTRLAEGLEVRGLDAVVNPLGELQNGRHLDVTLASFSATQKAVHAVLATADPRLFAALAETEA